MAQHARMQNADGSITVVNLDDGSAVIWEPGMTTVKGYLDANPQRAAALRTGDPAEIRAAQEQLDAQQRDLEQRLFDYGERAYGDTRTDREADVRFRNRQLRQSGDYQDRSLDQSGRQFDQNLDQRQLEHQDSVNQALQDLGLRQAQVGLGLVNTSAELHQQPQSWTKLNEWNRGVRQVGGVPVFAQKLLDASNGVLVQGLPTQTSGSPNWTPQPNSLGNVLSEMTGGTGGGGAAGGTDHRIQAITQLLKGQGISDTDGWAPEDVALIQAIGGIAKMGGKSVANTWSSLKPDEQQQILGGLSYLGQSPSTFQSDILAGRPGQGSILAA